MTQGRLLPTLTIALILLTLLCFAFAHRSRQRTQSITRTTDLTVGTLGQTMSMITNGVTATVAAEIYGLAGPKPVNCADRV